MVLCSHKIEKHTEVLMNKMIRVSGICFKILARRLKGVQYVVTERDLTLGGEHTV